MPALDHRQVGRRGRCMHDRFKPLKIPDPVVLHPMVTVVDKPKDAAISSSASAHLADPGPCLCDSVSRLAESHKALKKHMVTFFFNTSPRVFPLSRDETPRIVGIYVVDSKDAFSPSQRQPKSLIRFVLNNARSVVVHIGLKLTEHAWYSLYFARELA